MATRGVALGSFDVFHVGHLRALRRAVQLCDHLVIAVADDALVEQRCGSTPFVEASHRFEIVESFALGAEVVTTGRDTASHLVETYDVDLAIVAGGDAADFPATSLLAATVVEVESTSCETLLGAPDRRLLWAPRPSVGDTGHA